MQNSTGSQQIHFPLPPSACKLSLSFPHSSQWRQNLLSEASKLTIHLCLLLPDLPPFKSPNPINFW